ncbi:ABC transporter permease [bacterium]|nr:ABC transporter permease [bacterium]
MFAQHVQTFLSSLKRKPWALAAFITIIIYIMIAVLVLAGLMPADPFARDGQAFMPPGKDFIFGTDYLGRSIAAKVLHGTYIALSVGFIASSIAIPFGAALGLAAGYFGKRVDDVVVWLYSTVNSIPSILLLLAISFVMGRGLSSIYLAVALTSWTSICRLVRAETFKIKRMPYVTAATSLGVSQFNVIFKHILPNVFHLVVIDFSLRFIYAIKSEAILSYLGLGVQGQPSWGIMIADSKNELLNGYWWQLAAATAAMFFLVLALNILADHLRDVLDPKTESD